MRGLPCFLFPVVNLTAQSANHVVDRELCLGTAASRVAHCREDGVPFAGKSLGEQSAKAGAGTGDESHLVRTHDLCLLMACRYRENRLAHIDERVSRYENHACSSFSAVD